LRIQKDFGTIFFFPLFYLANASIQKEKRKEKEKKKTNFANANL